MKNLTSEAWVTRWELPEKLTRTLTSIWKNNLVISFGRLLTACLLVLGFPDDAFGQDRDSSRYQPSRRPTFRTQDRYGDPFSNTTTESPLFLKDPNKLKLDVDIDTALNYTIYEKIGDLNYRPTSSMSFEEFKQYQDRQILKDYWQNRSRAMDGESAVSGRGFTPKIFVSPILDRIFGGSYVELVPRGFVMLDLGYQHQKISNPGIPIRQQRNGSFEFDQQINMSVVGKVGEKLAVTANFDDKNSFDFQNNMKVEYTGYKEDILQKLEIGNVSLPLNNTLIQGAQNLFGVKAQMQFGKLNVTAIASTQRGKVESIDIPGGGSGQGRPFEIVASNYDENRHFFLGHFFRDNYRKWIANLPQINSGVNITRVEVYVLNRNNDTQTNRNIVGLMDLGEPRRIFRDDIISRDPAFPEANGNDANTLTDLIDFKSITRNADLINDRLTEIFGANSNGRDFEKITTARKLNPTEYTVHSQLGYITLTRKLQNDEALAVSYEYTYNGRPFKVGELSEDYADLEDEEVIFMKLLRPRKISIRGGDNGKGEIIPTWDLMMKNIYNLNVNQLTREGFQLRIIYRDDRTGIDNPQLQEGSSTLRERQLIEIFGLDKLNPVNDPQRDGNFDFVENITINTQTGLIIFPYLEPFSEALKEAFDDQPNESVLIQKYSYDTLYRTTKADAELFATKNKFFMVGTYSAGSSREILIPGFGVSQNSVKIFAGGMPLQEGTDYTVDYTFGKVTIINESVLSSGKNISVQYEQSDPFAFQTRSLIGTRFDYKLNDDVNLGSTFLYYNERPLISRNQIGTEPARNMQYGFDFNIRKDSRVLTKMIDAIPILQTKEPSSINFNGEFAQLIPGTSNIVGGEGTAYVDDFENTATPYSLMSPQGWKLAATPILDQRFHDEASNSRSIRLGYKRAKLAWYTVDNQFYRDGGQFKPQNVTEADLQNHYVRYVEPDEIFPYFQRQQLYGPQQIFDIAYYPAERGPYNYNPDINAQGVLRPGDLKGNWAGMTTAIRTEVDFDKANIEYVEFWLLNPFIEGNNGKVIIRGKNEGVNNTTGGKLIFQLGSISEDVARDSKHAFENGLPSATNPGGKVANEWGYVTTQQYLNNAFDNDPSSRPTQDVGLDGATNSEEAIKFAPFLDQLPADARALYENDPSGDDFEYFFGSEQDARGAQILERYKNYNGMDGNSPVNTGDSDIARAGTQVPDNEDLNADNTLSELEEYYEYDIDLKPGLEIGQEYIVDKIRTNDNVAGENIDWFLFRIPVRDFEAKFGNISGFKSIKYIRTILTGFEQPVVLRMANFRMIGSRWRRYQADLRGDGVAPAIEENYNDFTVSVVNLEENGAYDPNNPAPTSPYRIPPGVRRDRDNTSAISRQLNEQAVQVCVDNLEDGDARAIFKNVGVDLFNYGRIKMFFHAESALTQDDELYAFLRLGTDFDQNYYEIQIPLKFPQIVADPSDRDVWPEENEIDIDLNELYALKLRRDNDLNASTSAVYTGPPVGRHTIRIFGRPDLTSVQVMMIGVRNPRSQDGRAHTACIWANELRVTDFNRTAGWAATGTVSTKLADFATVTGALRHTTFGFGAVSSKIGERTRDETTAYDVSANVNVDKLLPGNTGIKIPMFVSYESTVINPNFDPANPDIRVEAAFKSFNSEQDRNDFKKLIQDRTVRRSLNFVNVKKNKVKPDAVSHIYDIENLSFSYSFSEATQTNFFTKENLLKQYRGSVAYNFSPKATGIEPFKSAKGLKSPYLKFIKDFNISFLPSNLSVRADVDRSFSKKVYRNSGGAYGTYSYSAPNYLKYFTFNRTYNLRWNFTRSLSLEYQARANAIIDEPQGDLVTQEQKDSVINNFKNFGRLKMFDQSFTVNYTLPLDKFPITDWLGAEYRYIAGYNWRAGPVNINDEYAQANNLQDIPDELDFKNTIQNTRENSLTGKVDFVKLYNKIKFLKEINTPARPTTPQRPVPGRTTPAKPVPADTVKKTPGFVKGFFRLLMSVRSLNGNYSLTEGTILPGFTETPKFFGVSEDWKAPGWKFVLGSQNPGIKEYAADRAWITYTPSLTTPFQQVRNEIVNLRANVEPSSELKIQLDVKKEGMSSYQEIFRYDDDIDQFSSLSPSRSGSYKISFNTINTAFKSSNNKTNSEVFQQFEQNLEIMKNRFQQVTGNQEYDSTTQDVVIPAFLAAYSGKSAETIGLGPFPKTPLPNWRIDYSGLGKIPALKEVFQAVTLSHGYQSTYSVVNYNNSLEFSDPFQVGINRPIEDYNNRYFGGNNAEGQFVPVYVITQVMISEQFSPLIGVNVRTKSRFTAKAEYKTKRDLMVTITNAQITEMNSKDVSFEVGYTKNNVKLPFKSQGRTIVLKNDVTFRMNVSVSDNVTIQRKVADEAKEVNGNLNFQLRPNMSYVVNQKLTLQAYFERNVREPRVTNSYPTATTRFGIQIRYSLAQ
ncbi:MAG TPA: cell surface protein SprA [Chryseosolibacter sp.]